EQKRRQAEYEQKLAANKAQQGQRDAAAAQAAAQEKQRGQQQAAEQMAVVLGDMQPREEPQQAQPAAASDNGPSGSPQVFPDSYGWYPMGYVPDGYYYNNAYRGAVNDRVADAYERWRQNPGAPAGA